MTDFQRRLFRAASAVAFTVAWPSASAGQVPLGAEFLVNSYTTGKQYQPSVAVQPQGGFIVTWSDERTWDVTGRRFGAAGAPIGSEFIANAYTTGFQWSPVVGAAGGGEFVVAWMSDGQDGSGIGIFGRRFDATGAPVGGEFQVNTTTSGHQWRPSLAVSTSGRFVVGWQARAGTIYNTVFAQPFDAAGNRVGAELPVNSPVTNQFHPAVAMNPGGDFIVAWADHPRHSIYARRYDAGGRGIGSEFRVNTNMAGSEISYPAVAGNASGEFVVAWRRSIFSPPPPFPPQPEFDFVHLQRFDASGEKVGGEYQVPGFDKAGGPKVAIHPGGRSTLVWGTTTPASLGVFKRAFDPAGRPVGPVDTVTAVSAGLPAIATEDSSRLVIAWPAPWLAPQDVRARRYDRLDRAGMAVDPTATPGSDGNGVAEADEVFTVAPVWANLHGGPVAFGGSAANFTGPGGPGNPVYSIFDGSADYGPVPGGGTGGCEDSTPDCYRLGISAPSVRPALHWDAAFDESLLPSSEHGGRTWAVHVGESFTDVPRGSPFYRFVETLLHRGVTGGCAGSSYCPASPTSREQMAVFALLGKEGTGYTPLACVAPNMFDDVPDSSPFCPWIEELARRGVVAGCGPGLYCPSASVSREQMAVFVLRALDGTLVPAACAPPNLFSDVPETSPFCRWIEELAGRGVVAGCAPGLYCPTQFVTREQMAVFIGATFGLTLYGP